MEIPTRVTLEVIAEGDGTLDTRAIDMRLGFRGVHLEHGVLADLMELESQGLIEKASGPPGGTGPRWQLTAAGVEWLAGTDTDELDG